MLEIDGSYGEGGGQIIRTSVSLSALTGTPARISNVRAKRSKPGLQPQHLAAVRAAAQICGAALDGCESGSTAFSFRPGSKPVSGSYFFDIGTAGSAPLVLQTVLLPLALSGGVSHVRIVGGTYNPHAPSADYLQHVYLPALHRMGVDARLNLIQAGYYPRGGGVIECIIDPAPELRPVSLIDRGDVKHSIAFIVTSSLPPTVGERGAATVANFAKNQGCDIDIQQFDLPSHGTGAAVLLIAEGEETRAGFLSIGERGKPMERVTEEACRDYLAWFESGAASEEHLADQLVLPSVLANGEGQWTTSKVSEHLRTVIWLVKQFVDVEASIDEPANAPATVRVKPKTQ